MTPQVVHHVNVKDVVDTTPENASKTKGKTLYLDVVDA
jgi:hypothetical protein